jgi:hypothetical protein
MLLGGSIELLPESNVLAGAHVKNRDFHNTKVLF